LETDECAASNDGFEPSCFERALESAQAAVRRSGLPEDWAHDLAQQALAELLEKGLKDPGDAEVEGTVRRLAERERKPRRRKAQRAAGAEAPDAQRRAVPPLLPLLAGLASFASDAERFRRVLRRAMCVVATAPGVLKDRQLRLFQLAYVEGVDLDQLTGMLGVSSRKATQRRLRRIARRVEAELIEHVRPVLGRLSLGLLLEFVSAKRGRPGSPEKKIPHDAKAALKRVCADLLSAVEAVIHRDPGHPLS